ncbi:Pimeloyl-ACP methyl ester carboxylesterase [Mucilaginibacter pineti]|uniref:Pimeloyl-ACP methyl ester carboxylesterase n=1 Tax=Mucilaginibacter pineti TaxID=1391627 RepID=A0A1G7HFC0_9SPHI|nr:alpha/beta hydrolase [Mucilaginibacter pineti]SDE99115.1 Pimeloyl-ACP methyl ester carboxylesterase [Mucilaginibacter pineti]
MTTQPTQAQTAGKYANVNGVKMYYEIHGAGKPLVLIHGGGSTLETTFGRIIPALAKTHRIIAVELQAHGHTGDRDAPETFKQDADDVAELLRQLNITKANVFGFSNGGQTTMEIAMRHPQQVDKLIIASAFYKRDGAPAGFWEGMKHAKFSDMPQVYKDEYLKINNDQAALLNMFNKDAQRMQTFKDWTEADLRSITAPALVVIGDHDLPTPAHAVEMSQLLPNGRLAILPGTHGSYMGEIMSPDANSKVPEFFVAMINEFLAAQ